MINTEADFRSRAARTTAKGSVKGVVNAEQDVFAAGALHHGEENLHANRPRQMFLRSARISRATQFLISITSGAPLVESPLVAELGEPKGLARGYPAKLFRDIRHNSPTPYWGRARQCWVISKIFHRSAAEA